MNCVELAANLTDFLDGVLDIEAEAAALEHLATCESCESVLAQTRAVISLAGRHGRVDLAPEERALLLDRILTDAGLGDG
jgi:anti-sigma factor RsiW